MVKKKPHSPLLGYNTNVRHAGILFHIQTEDSGVGHPHIITHLFTEGTILATKKTSYAHILEEPDLEAGIRQMMKNQHRAMFIELRDGVHDAITTQILGAPIGEATPPSKKAAPAPKSVPPPQRKRAPDKGAAKKETGVRVVQPAVVDNKTPISRREEPQKGELTGRSIFDTPAEDGDFGDSLITDKSLDEVILSYLTEELDE